MSEPYLILHKVRGEPAFDIAIKVQVGAEDETQPGWIGEWWIIPTSGHRAHPYWSKPLNEFVFNVRQANNSDVCNDFGELAFDGFTWHDIKDVPQMPSDLPDHYAINDAPKPKTSSPRVLSTTDDFLV